MTRQKIKLILMTVILIFEESFLAKTKNLDSDTFIVPSSLNGNETFNLDRKTTA